MLHPTEAKIRSFRVIPDLPDTLAPLLEIAHNFWWSWHPEAASLFRRLDRELWRSTRHNPVKFLGSVRQDILDRAANDRSYLHALGHAYARLQDHMTRASWFQRCYKPQPGSDPRSNGEQSNLTIAYFSAEFGLAECFQIYSGGLGCLAGDHLKSASELGLPLVGVGLLYRCGYFHQYLNADGWQQETYPDLDFPNQPVHRVIDPTTGEQYRVEVEMPDRHVVIGVWRCNVGRVPLYLLDTNMPENAREDREITRNLYGGDVETRIRQEIVLGIGGVRALRKMGVAPDVYHMNEGHSAFLALEHIRMLREQTDVSFDEARHAAAARQVFTTHTPVPAGIDRFSPELVERYLAPMTESLGLTLDGLLSLGRENVFDRSEFFSMAVLAIRTSDFANGVSRLHGEVSRSMWNRIWPGLPAADVPIGHITNGVHARSWMAPELMSLFDRYISSEWLEDPTDESVWKGIGEIPDDELWSFQQEQRKKLVSWCRRKIREQMTMRGCGVDEIERSAAALDPNVFTIGFARRFATYKRANLLLRDRERLMRLLENEERPIQIIIAGKSHPADSAGKELIREIVNFSSQGGRSARVVFLEDYDIAEARRMVRGCDIWLNTPRRGLEASGTSGMKAAMNGVVNVSVLDGWWDEAYNPDFGFAIGRGEQYRDPEEADIIESRNLYNLLERIILPEFYSRNLQNVPTKWVARMKESIQNITPVFNTNRMVAQYAEHYYFPSAEAGARLMRNDLEESRGVSHQIERLRTHWEEIVVEEVETSAGASVPVRSLVDVQAVVRFGALRPEEIRLQLYEGEVTSLGELNDATSVDMTLEKDLGDGRYRFTGRFTPSQSGRRGFTVRVIPSDERLVHPYLPGLITWHTGESPSQAHGSPTKPALHADA